MKQVATLKLDVELRFDATEKVPDRATGRAMARAELVAEAARRRIGVTTSDGWTYGPLKVGGSSWDGKNQKVDFQEVVFGAWTWVP